MAGGISKVDSLVGDCGPVAAAKARPQLVYIRGPDNAEQDPEQFPRVARIGARIAAAESAGTHQPHNAGDETGNCDPVVAGLGRSGPVDVVVAKAGCHAAGTFLEQSTHDVRGHRAAHVDSGRNQLALFAARSESTEGRPDGAGNGRESGGRVSVDVFDELQR
uniref:(northern house mosquito) hypothetical protein n=1 Tax=Culex pipiens TaxID=7175 RepID=A0A8D8HDA0_CULPI